MVRFINRNLFLFITSFVPTLGKYRLYLYTPSPRAVVAQCGTSSTRYQKPMVFEPTWYSGTLLKSSHNLPTWHTPGQSPWSPRCLVTLANVAQPGTAQPWNGCFRKNIPVQIRALASFFYLRISWFMSKSEEF